jgi:peptidylprolyl isomerase
LKAEEDRVMRNWVYGVIAALVALVALAGCGASSESTASEQVPGPRGPVEEGVKPRNVVVPPGKPPEDLAVADLREGTGRKAKPGPFLTVQYVALRWDGEPFQSSWDYRQFESFAFRLGGDPPQVNPGWEKGLLGMRVGGRRELIVPPKDLYETKQPPELMESDDTIVYVVELLEVGM